MLGQTIGRYRVVDRLGEGGMGTVWKAKSATGEPVALKLLSPQLIHSPEARMRFLREARSIESLDHPGVAKLFEAGEHDGQMFLAVEFVDGSTIAQLLDPDPLEPREAVRIAGEAALALDHAHSRGVIHRDVSARNIMVARDGRVVMIDFGLARLAEGPTLTTSTQTMGTVAFMSPEVVLGRPAEPRSDVYSLAVVLYEMLTGTLPFLNDRSEAMLYAVAHERPEPPSVRRPRVPRALDKPILKALAKDPARRQASAAEFEAEVRGAMEGVAARRAAAGANGAAAARPRRARATRRCVAVMPFETPGAEEGDDAPDDTFAATLCASLGRLQGLEVISPDEARRVAETEGDALAAAKKLGARWLVTGTARRAGEKLRVTYSVHLVARGRQIAGDRLDGPVADPFAIEDELFAAVVRALQMDDPERRTMSMASSARFTHENYLQALRHLQRTEDPASMDAAIALLEELVSSEGSSGLVHAALGKAYLRKAEITHEPELTKKAEDSCRAALSLDPHSAEVLVTLGRLLFRTGRPEEAASTLRRSLEIDQRNPDAWLILSRLHESHGRFDEAEKAARQVIELRPDDWKGYDRLGVLEFRRGHYPQAAAAWERALERSPENAPVYGKIGAARLLSNDLEGALDAYEHSVHVRPATNALIGLGTVRFALGRKNAAIDAFEAACALTPKDPRAWENLADAQRWTPGCEGRAPASFDRAIELDRADLEADRANPEVWASLAKSLAKRGQTAASLDAIQRALELASTNANVLSRSVTVFELAGLREKALAHLSRAIEIGYGRAEFARDPELKDLVIDSLAQKLLKDAGEVPSSHSGSMHQPEEEADAEA